MLSAIKKSLFMKQQRFFIMAEKEGFEPSRPFPAYTISSRAPSTKLGDFSTTSAILACIRITVKGKSGQIRKIKRTRLLYLKDVKCFVFIAFRQSRPAKTPAMAFDKLLIFIV